MRNKWSQEDEQAAEQFMLQCCIDFPVGFNEQVHGINQFHDRADGGVEIKLAIQIIRYLGNGLMETTSQCGFIRCQAVAVSAL